MSNWTNIAVVLDVDTCMESENPREEIEELLKDAPKITGSEGNAEIFVNIPSGYNTSHIANCSECKHYTDKVRANNEPCLFYSDPGCPIIEYQTRATITIQGNLRDRKLEETTEEYKKFSLFINDTLNFLVINEAVSIQ